MERARTLTLVRGAVRGVLVAAIALTLFVAYGLIDNAWYKVLAVQGGSMEPTISAGDLIVITRAPASVEVGQVLTLQVDGAVVTHRVVAVEADGTFTTQGDANATRDDFSANDVHIVGEYRFGLPLIGRLVTPIVSGAWAADGDAIAATARSGEWPEPATATAVGREGQITWRPSASPTPAPTPTPTPSPTPEATGAATAPPTSDGSAAASASSSPVPAAPTDAASPTPEPPPTEEPLATPSTDATPTPTPTPTPTAAALPTATPTPTPTP